MYNLFTPCSGRLPLLLLSLTFCFVFSRPEKQERARDDNFKDWRRRFGEATMQRLGLAQEIRDANTGDIESPLNRYPNTPFLSS